MLSEVLRLFVVAGTLFFVVVAGWNEPLRYRFMSRQEIAAVETPPVAEPVNKDWMWDRAKRTRLDHGAYGSSRSGAGMQSYR